MTIQESFYVMHEAGGDECVLFRRSEFMAALSAGREEAARDRRARLSIWSSTRGILVLPAERSNRLNVCTRSVTPEERTLVEGSLTSP